MQMRTLGRSGVQVSEHCLGAMMFGQWGEPDHDECVRIIHRALDAGINFIDTADVYSAGESEEIVGKALRDRRDQVVVATKFFAPMGKDPNMHGGSRRWIFQEVENSLRRLGTDYIDLYQIHRPDDHADIDETLGALSDLVHQGKIRYLGHSTFPAEYIVEAQWVSERRNRERFVCEQPPYSILVRGIERAVLPTCARYGIGVIPWSPLAGGLLTGRYRKGQPAPEGSRLARGFGSQHQNPRQQRAHEARLGSGRGAAEDRRRCRREPHAPRARVRPRAPERHLGDHRAANDGAARRRARGCGSSSRRGDARCHRRGGAPGDRDQRRRPVAATRSRDGEPEARVLGQLVGSVLRSIRPSSIAPVNPPSAMRSKPFT